MTDEERFIIGSFERNFRKYTDEPLVIYGLGKNTKVILEHCRDNCIVGLMDGVRTGETVWGLPVLSLTGVKKTGVKKIIIVATSANVPIIYHRIEKFCQENEIMVFDINGTVIQSMGTEYILPDKYEKITEKHLKEAILSHDVISFDIFDTLLVRKNLLPTDVFEMVYQKNRESIPEDVSFVKLRISCERELYQDTNPTIEEIYGRLIAQSGISEDLGYYLMEQEIMEERRTLHPRKTMISMVQFALEMGKTVCCTSDMYLPEHVLKEMLCDAGYPDFDMVFVSCEYRTGKCDGLYQYVKNKYEGKKILHIGDNETADGRIPPNYEIDSFLISSIYQMITDSKMSDVLSCTESLGDRNYIGELFSDMFNNPFLFSETAGKGMIKSGYDLGYYFMEPIIRLFLKWMMEQCEKEGIDHVLLASRDGWLIREMLYKIGAYGELSFTYDYFYASRAACTLAGMLTGEDVKYAAHMAFDGSLEELLSKRFRLNEFEIKKRMSDETDEQFLERHVDVVLEKAQLYRNYYREYIEKQKMSAPKIGFFDFVSSGTCQLWLENIMGESMYGLYFIRNIDPYKSRLNIASMYPPKYVYEKQNKVYENYIFMENILTSPEPTLNCIMHDKLLFEDETRSKNELLELHNIHQGILDAFEKQIRDQIPVVSRELAEMLLEFVGKDFCKHEFTYFEESTLEDEFCNRSFALKNIV